MSKKNTLLKIIIPILIIIAGITVMKLLMASKTEPRKEPARESGILVSTFEAVKQDYGVTINGTGTVSAAEEVSVVPQVSGRIVSLSPNLVVGGMFKKGDPLFKIEDIDYILALEQAKAARSKAKYDMATIEGRARIARAEWEELKKDTDSEPNPLVLYEPQLANAKAALLSADAAVKQAKLALDRTTMKAPFNSRVKSESVDIGQYLKSGNSAAVLTGTDRVEINVPLSSEDISWLNIPMHGEDLNGPDALVKVNAAGQSHKWKGRVLRSTGEVDMKSRMMQVIVQVSDPYSLSEKNSSRPALPIGTFVAVEIKGKGLKDVFIIPRTAYRDSSTVWLMDDDNKLRLQNVEPARIEKDSVVISSGLEAGDRIISTNISGAANGMKLRELK